MITFIVSAILLIASYFIYGTWVEKKFGADPNCPTPAFTKQDGVDYVPMNKWKIFLIQFLNIAGLGPIFGAIAGAMWGPSAFLWIVFGCIFGGAVHDYFSGMLSVKHGGASLPEIVGQYLGPYVKIFLRIFSVVLLILVGVVFIMGPAGILHNIFAQHGWVAENSKATIFVACIFIYYILATMIPIDKLIGKIYPLFGMALLVMAGGIFIVLLVGGYQIPEVIPSNLVNMHHSPEKFPLFPMLFITIACGAISGFHSTQSPLMARCLPNERDGKLIFFGAMIAEGIVALIWAAAAMSFFDNVDGLNDFMASNKNNAALVVDKVCNTMLGKIGGILALIGVVAAPITSGDTAFRSARLIVTDAFNFPQKKLVSRLIATIPLFVVGFILTNVEFGIIWRYFGWANQTLAAILLWASAAYMQKVGRNTMFVFIPAVFMTVVVSTYIIIAPEGFGLPMNIGLAVGIIAAVVCSVLFILNGKKKPKINK